MRQTISGHLPASGFQSVSLDDLERNLTRSPTVARCLIVGLPSLGILASLVFDLPLFAALMSGSFLLATALVARKALVRFTGRTLRLLVAARLMIVLMIGALLFCASGSTWVGIVSTLLLWLTMDRLLGRHALADLGKHSRHRQATGVISANDRASRAAEGVLDGRLFQPRQEPVAEEAQPRRRGRGNG